MSVNSSFVEIQFYSRNSNSYNLKDRPRNSSVPSEITDKLLQEIHLHLDLPKG